MLETESHMEKGAQATPTRPGEIRRLAFFMDRGVYVPKNGSQEIFTRVTPSQRPAQPKRG